LRVLVWLESPGIWGRPAFVGNSDSLRTDVYLPNNGKPYPGNPVVGPKEKTLPGGKTKQQRITHYIPGNTPFGVFTYTTTINSVLSDDILDEDSFRFVIEE
jgi:hypothetical protein